jgi:hypothetical protein
MKTVLHFSFFIFLCVIIPLLIVTSGTMMLSAGDRYDMAKAFLLLTLKLFAVLYPENGRTMKKNLQTLAGFAQLLNRNQSRTLTGGLLPLYEIHECRVSPRGYTAGFVCVLFGQQNPQKVCDKCYGVTYNVLTSYAHVCQYCSA